MWKIDRLFQNFAPVRINTKNVIHNEFKRLRYIVAYETRKPKKD